MATSQNMEWNLFGLVTSNLGTVKTNLIGLGTVIIDWLVVLGRTMVLYQASDK